MTEGITSAADAVVELISPVSCSNGARSVFMFSMRVHWFVPTVAGNSVSCVHAKHSFLFQQALHVKSTVPSGGKVLLSFALQAAPVVLLAVGCMQAVSV